MRTGSPPEEPSVQVLDITQGGATTQVDSGSRNPRWLAVAVVAALLAGLGYGFALGRGGRPVGEMTDPTLPTGPPATPDAISETSTDPVRFQRVPPGRQLGVGVTEYLNANLFATVAVDDAGVVWAGGPTGVVRFDPATEAFERLTGSDGTGPLDVLQLTPGPNGSLYVATGRGLSVWDGEEWAQDSVLVRVDTERGADAPQMGTIAVADDGTLWVATHGLSEDWYDESQILHGAPPFAGEVATTGIKGHVLDLGVDRDGTVWALTEVALWKYGTRWNRTSLRTYNNRSMAVTPAGAVLVATHNEMIRWAGDVVTETWGWEDFFGAAFEGFDFACWMAAGPDGSAWLVAKGYAWGNELDHELTTKVVRVAGDGTLTIEEVPVAIDQSGIADLAVAPNGDVWFATETGLVRFDGVAWSEFRLEDQPPIGYVSSMTVDTSGGLWLAGETGIVQSTDDTWQIFEPGEITDAVPDGVSDEWGWWPPPEETNWVTAGAEGAVWAGSGCGASAWESGSWRPLPPLPDWSGECWEVHAQAADDGSLWLAVNVYDDEAATVAYRWDGGGWAFKGEAPMPASATHLSPEGALWLSGWDGIGWLGNAAWHSVLSGLPFQDVVATRDGSIWAVHEDWPDESALWHLVDGAWTVEEPPFEQIAALHAGNDGSLWALLRFDDGRARAVSITGQAPARPVVNVGDLSAMTLGPDGTIWAAGYGRLYRVDPR